MTETLQLRGRFAGVDLDELVDARVVRTWLYWGMFWLMVTPTVGVTISGLFNFPDYLGTTQLGADIRPASAHPRQRRDHGRLFVAVHRRMLLSGAAAVRRSRGLGRSWACRRPGCGNLALMAGLIGLGFGVKSRARGRRAAAVSPKFRFSSSPRRPPRSSLSPSRGASSRRSMSRSGISSAPSYGRR